MKLMKVVQRTLEFTGISTYPTIFNNEIQIEIDSESILEKELQIQLFDLNGQVVQEIQLQGSTQITMGEVAVLPPGNYLLQINGLGAPYTQKLVKM